MWPLLCFLLREVRLFFKPRSERSLACRRAFVGFCSRFGSGFRLLRVYSVELLRRMVGLTLTLLSLRALSLETLTLRLPLRTLTLLLSLRALTLLSLRTLTLLSLRALTLLSLRALTLLSLRALSLLLSLRALSLPLRTLTLRAELILLSQRALSLTLRTLRRLLRSCFARGGNRFGRFYLGGFFLGIF